MPNEIAQVVVKWTGFSGAPGFTNLFFNDFTEGTITQAIVDGALARADVWVSSWKTRLPSTVTVQVDNQVKIIDVPTGNLTRFMSGAVKTPYTGTGTGNYSAAAGLCISWTTNGLRTSSKPGSKPRRVRGRTFIVPLAGSALDATGTIANAELTAFNTNTQALLAPGANQGLLGVYARPSAKGATDGAWFGVSSFNIQDKTAILRSRRD